jgi:hypothetical protein
MGAHTFLLISIALQRIDQSILFGYVFNVVRCHF